MMKSFHNMMLSWKVLADVWSSCSVKNPFAPASEERNSKGTPFYFRSFKNT